MSAKWRNWWLNGSRSQSIHLFHWFYSNCVHSENTMNTMAAHFAHFSRFLIARILIQKSLLETVVPLDWILRLKLSFQRHFTSDRSHSKELSDSIVCLRLAMKVERWWTSVYVCLCRLSIIGIIDTVIHVFRWFLWIRWAFELHR